MIERDLKDPALLLRLEVCVIASGGLCCCDGAQVFLAIIAE